MPARCANAALVEGPASASLANRPSRSAIVIKRAHLDGGEVAEDLEREGVHRVHVEGGSRISHEDLQWLTSAARHTAPYSTCPVRQLFLSAIR